MADRCVFFADLLAVPDGRARRYALVEPPGTGLACVDASLRRGGDWYFARRWVRTGAGPRELYRLLDRLESRGFRFRVDASAHGGPTPTDVRSADADGEEFQLRASQLHATLSADERRIHAELFPDEAALLAAGYDWDGAGVYRRGAPLAPDPFGRFLDADGGVLYEWVRVPDELTWRRYPLERLRTAVTPAGT